VLTGSAEPSEDITEQADEGYIVIFDLNTMVGELCIPQKHIVGGKKY
jgi:hypothetical protein